MSEYPDPERADPEHVVTLEDIRALTAPSTPHFAQQIAKRIRTLIARLPPEHPARVEGERQIALMRDISFDGEFRGVPAEDGLPPLVSVSAAAAAATAAAAAAARQGSH